MPRNVRNFWAEVRTDDGRHVATGPQARDGGMEVVFYQRHRGMVTDGFRIVGRALGNGTLILTVYGPDGAVVGEHRTER